MTPFAMLGLYFLLRKPPSRYAKAADAATATESTGPSWSKSNYRNQNTAKTSNEYQSYFQQNAAESMRKAQEAAFVEATFSHANNMYNYQQRKRGIQFSKDYRSWNQTLEQPSAGQTPVEILTQRDRDARKLLGIDEQMLTSQINEEMLKNAFNAKALKAHPDVGGNAQIFFQIRQAYLYILKKMQNGQKTTNG